MVQVNMGHRKVALNMGKEHSGQLLENGRELRKSKAYPIKCSLKLNRVLKTSRAECEKIRLNREKMVQDGKLDPYDASLPVSPYSYHWVPHYAIIPPGGISKKGYVKEVWVEYITEQVEIDNQYYDLMTPYVHDTKRWILGFMLDSDNLIKLLPSPKIVVKYFKEIPCPIE